ncbi:MAG: hypothetical protein KGH64_03605 [Candidatus Micrarchaeota archaeon]|nr:hypothetical protein [Candidatus Micrarchaeota archaeon]MDE1859222.1 hypothetical protein [Candidatus Micrarchaeota archaeon]
MEKACLSFMILFLLIYIAAAAVNAATASTFITAQYTPHSVGSPLSSPYISSSQLSPAAQVYAYNNKNALWLITCPQNPASLSSNPQYAFSTQPGDFGDFMVAGNACDLPSTSQTFHIKLTLTDTPSSSISGAPTASDFNVTLAMSGAATLHTTDLGFSPEVNTGSGGIVSTNFNTKTYMFQSIPPHGQQGLWTWYGLVADPNQLNSIYASGPQLSVSGNSKPGQTYTYSYTTTSGGGSTLTCAYSYSLTSKATLTSLGGTTVPFPTSGSGSTNLNFIPYLTYDANITNPEPANEFNTALTYDLYSPYNIQNPQGRIDPIGINSITYFFSAYNQSVTASSGGATTGGSSAGGTWEQTIWTDLINEGYTSLEAAGIMGNAAQETGGQTLTGIDPECNVLGCFGFISWSPQPPGLSLTGNKYSDIETQIQYLATSSTPSPASPTESWWPACSASASCASQYAIAFMQNFEKCSGYSSPPSYGACNGPVRESQAQQAWNDAQAGGWPQRSTPSGGSGSGGSAGGSSGATTSNVLTWISTYDEITLYANMHGNYSVGLGNITGSSSSSSGGTAGAGSCPNKAYPAFESGSSSSGTLTLQQLVDCAVAAGFTGDQVITVVAMAYQESSWQPGELEGGGCAAGILQEGFTPCSSSGGLLVPQYSSPAGYDPTTCSTYNPSQAWMLYMNPLCSFKWAYYEFKADGNSFYNFWGSYDTGAYCNWAPSGWAGGGSFGGVTCSGSNNEGASWSTVCPGNSCKSTGGSSGPSSSGGSSIYIVPNSITAIPQGYIYILGQGVGGPSPGSASASSGSGAYPVGSGCTVERTDMGKDWSGSCPLYAIASGTVHFVFNYGPGGGCDCANDWYGEFFYITFDSPITTPTGTYYDAYYAEDVSPSVTDGENVTAGQQIGTAVGGPDGMELGWTTPSEAPSAHTLANSEGYGGTDCTPAGDQYVTYINTLYSSHNLAVCCTSSGPACFTGAPSGPSPPPPGGASSTTISGTNLYILHVVPYGEFNASAYPPNSMNIAYASSPGAFENNWNTYWQNLQSIQSTSVYVYNSIPIVGQSGGTIPASGPLSVDQAIEKQIIHKSCGGTDPTANGCNNPLFQPVNVTSDDYGDVYIVGQCSGCAGGGNEHTWIVSISNTLKTGDMVINVEPTCPKGNDVASSDGDNYALCTANWDEIAVSPTGSQVYLANPTSGMIPIMNGQTLKYGTAINLNYGTDQALYQDLSSYLQAYPPAINITDYFRDGGLYGIYTHNQAGKTCKSAAVPGCNSENIVLHNITSTELSGLSAASSAFNNQPDMLDHSAWDSSGGNWNKNFHHPLAIQDVHGYLYVLDYWSGVTGQVCQSIIGSGGILGPHVCAQVGLPGCILGCITDGIDFGALTLRVINSSGVDLPILPTYQNDLWQCTTPACNNFNKFTQNSNTYYPPFGWVISATLMSHDSADTNHVLSVCGGGTTPNEVDNQNPSGPCYQPSQYYKGTYLPIGPKYNIFGCSGSWPSETCKTRNLIGASMSVSFNDTVEIFIPSQGSIGIKNTANPARNSELILARFVPENYTRQIGGTNYLPFYYACYDSNFNPSNYYDPKTGTQYTGLCKWEYSVHNITSPTYLFTNPFQYDENIGSYQQLTLDEILSSSINPSSTITGPSAISNPYAIQSSGNFNRGASSAFSTYTCISGPPCPTVQQTSTPTKLESKLSGYMILPYSYTYTLTWAPTAVSGGGPGCSDSALFSPPGGVTQTFYNYTESSAQGSAKQVARVEGAQSYAQSAVNSSQYWQAFLNASSVPAELFYNMLTDRQFGQVYINSTISPYTNFQKIINASNIFTYTMDLFGQGSNPGYAMIGAQPENPPCTGPTCAPSLTNTGSGHIFTNINDNFSANTLAEDAPQVVALFNWYKVPIHNNPIDLTLNRTRSGSGFNPYGYHRIVEVYNDRFNNTLYMPLDVDIANITLINLTVAPVVDSSNANKTYITVNGTAYTLMPFTTNTKPLKNADIYLYYDVDLNVNGYNPITQAQYTQNCAFTGSAVTDSKCALSNPVWNGIGANAGALTYNTDLNRTNNCSPPPNSLLTPTGNVYRLCNIYNDPIPGVPAPTYNCPTSISGHTQYCIPLYANGTGYCTPQLGLFAIAKTNNKGYFSISNPGTISNPGSIVNSGSGPSGLLACGYGQHNIIAQYYGTPAPEPIYPTQSGIGLAANPSSTDYATFTAVNYSWTPVQVVQPAAIGTIFLSIGNISVVLGLFIVAAVLIIAITLSRLHGPKRKKHGH